MANFKVTSFPRGLRTRREKSRFVRDLARAVAAEIVKKIDAGKVPAEWDGHELRRLLADKFEREVTGLMKKGRRLRDYRSDVYNNNL